LLKASPSSGATLLQRYRPISIMPMIENKSFMPASVKVGPFYSLIKQPCNLVLLLQCFTMQCSLLQ
jgi:hypothetical protein